MYVYIYKHSFIATAPFPMGQQCQYLAHGSWPCQRGKKKKEKTKQYIGQDISSFFFPKIGI